MRDCHQEVERPSSFQAGRRLGFHRSAQRGDNAAHGAVGLLASGYAGLEDKLHSTLFEPLLVSA